MTDETTGRQSGGGRRFSASRLGGWESFVRTAYGRANGRPDTLSRLVAVSVFVAAVLLALFVMIPVLVLAGVVMVCLLVVRGVLGVVAALTGKGAGDGGPRGWGFGRDREGRRNVRVLRPGERGGGGG